MLSGSEGSSSVGCAIDILNRLYVRLGAMRIEKNDGKTASERCVESQVCEDSNAGQTKCCGRHVEVLAS